MKEYHEVGPRWGCACLFIGCLAGALLLGQFVSLVATGTVHAVGPGQGGATTIQASPTCGHPQEVFTFFHLAPTLVPSQDLLRQLPPPTLKKAVNTGDVTYDPQKDELCAVGPDTLKMLYVAPQQQSATTSQSEDDNWLIQAVQAFFGWLLQQILTFFQSVLDIASSFGFVFIYPKDLTYDHEVVKSLFAWSLGAMDGALALILVVAGYNYLVGRYHDFLDLAFRLAVAAIAAHFSLLLLSPFIELVDTASTSLFLSLSTVGLGDMHLPLQILNWVTAPEYEVVVYVLEVVISLVFVLFRLGQVALLDLLLIVAPFGFLCFALPQTQAWARLWAQALASLLVVQVLQVLCLSLGNALIATFGHGSLTVMTIFIGIAALFLALQLPNMMLSQVLRASHQSMVGVIRAGAELIAFYSP